MDDSFPRLWVYFSTNHPSLSIRIMHDSVSASIRVGIKRSPMQQLKLILVDPIIGLIGAFEEAFKDLPNVEIIHGFFQNVSDFDCMVSAANSFGLMDGGVDAAIVKFFGSQLMFQVQERILTEYLGEQPIG